ncbi:hypothetical protein LVO79_20765 (plasmid) [Roseivivax marinus]|uniref:class I SAM-dependent methyltransferase n=1 Tax=Roseivivax marinus TaxID=1379903 RepID=UPI001F040F90|nr:class I SAM-dependent methyltransferase [Roseivivax marinus]UMA67206.1 hypothetical protein LVO79_20765 [Roseivivax marinus]
MSTRPEANVALPDILREEIMVPLSGRAAFWTPRSRLEPAFLPHVPELFWLAEIARPKLIVALGLGQGQCFFALAQAMERLNHAGHCRGVAVADIPAALSTHAETVYPDIAKLEAGPVCEALGRFQDGTVGLLTIDAALPKEDLDGLQALWSHKLTEDGVVVIRNYLGVESEAAREFVDVARDRYPSLSFDHGEGVCIILASPCPDARLLTAASFAEGSEEWTALQAFFARLGGGLIHDVKSGEIAALQAEIERRDMDIETLRLRAERTEQIHLEEIVALTRQAESAIEETARCKVENKLVLQHAEALKLRRLPAFLDRVRAREIRATINTVSNSSNFDRDWYLTSYPDVHASGMDPAAHFVLYGLYEGRRPSRDFDPIAYLRANPDALESGTNPLVHAAEGLSRK